MDGKNVGRSNHKSSRYRSLRSTSSPSGTHNDKFIGPQRAQSQLVVGANIEPNVYQTLPVYMHSNNSMFHEISNGYYYPPNQWNSSIPVRQNQTQNLFLVNSYVKPITSSNDFSQFPRKNVSTFDQSSCKKQNRNVSERKWESVGKNTTSDKKFIFTVMSYNVLAQDLVENHAYLYQQHNNECLRWQVRWVNILREIGEANPDIICFQEVQESHIRDFFSILEKNLGYKSLYKKRTGVRTDGCAIYYKKKRLQLMEYEKVEFFQQDIPILNRDNVAIVARFIPKEVNMQAFIVATTHLLYNPKRQDVRLAQVQSLFAEIDKMAFVCTKDDGSASYLPIIVTGDLNATPDSAIYEFITRSVLDYENLSRRGLTKEVGKELTGKVLVPESLQLTDNCQYAGEVMERNHNSKRCSKDRGENIQNNSNYNIKFSSGTLSHPFSFKSTYNHVSNNDVEGSTYQDRWITVDYIFYSGKRRKRMIVEDKLKLLARYRLLTKTQLNGVKIPNWKLGSDHFSLIVKFALE